MVAYFAMSWSYQPGEHRSGVATPPKGEDLRAVMLVHPDCPCTEASLNLYLNAVNKTKSPLKTLIVIPGPSRSSRNITLARTIPNSQLKFLSAEDISKQYGISTSGHLLVWNGQKLVFSGGVTDARGEEVAAGAFDELTAVLGSTKAAGETPVFGCPAYNHEVVR